MAVMFLLQLMAYVILIFKGAYHLVFLLVLCDTIFAIKYINPVEKGSFKNAIKRIKLKISIHSLILGIALVAVLLAIFSGQNTILSVSDAIHIFTNYHIFILLSFVTLMTYKVYKEREHR